MARIRSVHPSLFTDEAFVSCGALARLLWIGIWTEADDQGVFEWKPVTLKMRLLPIDVADVSALLEELETFDLVKSFELGGRKFGVVRNFRKFQRPKKPNSVHHIPDEFRTYAGLDRLSSELSDAEASAVPPKAEIAQQMEDGGKEERKKKKGASASSPGLTLEPTFPPWWPQEAWKAYTEMRKKMRKPLTDLAIQRAVREVTKLKDSGHDPGEVVGRSAFKGWTDFYAPKAPEPAQNGGANGHSAPVSEGWEAKIERFKDRGIWLSPDGPPPTDPDCNAPQNLLVKHGYREARH